MYDDYEPMEVDEKDFEDEWAYADFLRDAIMEEKAIEEYEREQKEKEESQENVQNN